MVSGLKGAPQFNGLKATVVGKRADRVEVEIEAEGGKKLLALKPENLSAAVPAAPRRRKGKWEEPNSGGYVVGRKLLKALPAMEELEQLPATWRQPLRASPLGGERAQRSAEGGAVKRWLPRVSRSTGWTSRDAWSARSSSKR